MVDDDTAGADITRVYGASGTFDWDLSTGTFTWGERLLALFGYDTDPDTDPSNQRIEAFNARLHPDDLPRVTAALRSAIDCCGEYEAEYRVLLPDGATRWVTSRGRAIGDETGVAARVLGAAYDTTAMREGEARVARVLEAMPAAFCSLDREWRFTYVNAEAERILGLTREQLIGAPQLGPVPGHRRFAVRGELPAGRGDR